MLPLHPHTGMDRVTGLLSQHRQRPRLEEKKQLLPWHLMTYLHVAEFVTAVGRNPKKYLIIRFKLF